MQWSCAKIRETFLEYFKSKQHEIIKSSPLVPANDNTLLFTNAGMVQFKDVFLGTDKRSYSRATTTQRCVRAGGKHNDLENVGYTARHHTFFEMLGNFSFGDYFKQEAIQFAWEFLTEVIKLPPEKLWVTVFEEDDEAAAIWLDQIGVDPARFSRIGAKDNFWSMGDTGPCGPCSEIFYDHGSDIPGGPPGSPDEDGDRYIEIWNLVFMQFDRQPDGEMLPLPKPSVDTGMGLERLAAILQGVHSNYEIDIFVNLIKEIARVTHSQDLESKSLRVIADHIRACSFLITDGIYPSNEGRGYVLRRIMRRAIRHGYMMGVKQPFFYKIVDCLCQQMGDAFPELAEKKSIVEDTIKREEEQFLRTIDQGLKILSNKIETLEDSVIPGDTVFELDTTYGFPADLTADIARERELTIDHDGYQELLEEHKKISKEGAGDKFGVKRSDVLDSSCQTEFVGYDALSCESAVTAILVEEELSETLTPGRTACLVIDKSSFYAESGGQVGDIGEIKTEDAVFEVIDTKKHPSGAYLHIGTLKSGKISVGDQVTAVVNEENRQAIRLNHTATHLLHAALRQVLGEHVTQKGSLVNAERLRFDFSHFEPVSAANIQKIEKLVNDNIRINHDAQTRLMDYEDAIKEGAMALFDEKYDDQVRVLKLGDFSTELCGGTHVSRVGDIGVFKIINETGIASGVRRIEAVTGQNALNWIWANEKRLATMAEMLKTDFEHVDEKLEQHIDKSRQMQREYTQLKSKMASQKGTDLASQAREIAGIPVLASNLEGADVKTLRETVDQLKNKLHSGVIVLGTVSGDKATLIAGVTDDLVGRIKAGDLVNRVATFVDGRGGGKPSMAQAGGTNPDGLEKAISSVHDIVSEML